MNDVVYFFWERWRRAVQMDMANKLSGRPTYFWINSEEWTAAYKDTLSKNKKDEFDKEWKRLDDYYHEWQNADAKKQAKMQSPFKNMWGKA